MVVALVLNPVTLPAASANAGQSVAGLTAASDSVAPPDRQRLLGAGWRESADRSVTEDGDATGLHVLVADARDGYAWRTAASLSEAGVETDRWIGQHCITRSGRYAAVVYAPRQTVNHEDGFHAGGLAAIVDLDTGTVRKLPFTVSLAYYNPGCGVGDDVVFTRNAYAGATYVSQLNVVNAPSASVTRTVAVHGQVSSAVPYRGGIAVATAAGPASVDGTGATRLLAAAGSPFRLSPDGDGGLGFEVRTLDGTELHRFDGTRETTVARVPTDSVQLHEVAGRVFVQGADARKLAVPPAWAVAGVAAGAQLSTTGAFAVHGTDNFRGAPGGSVEDTRPVSIATEVLATGAHPDFTVAPHAIKAMEGVAPSPALGSTAGTSRAAVADPSTDTTDPNRKCAVARNDPKIQSLQPTPEMAEWAANLAVKGQLTIQRPAHYNGSDLPAYTPQGLFPARTLAGAPAGAQVPAQILLGVMAQESNMWQASPHATDGESGNFEQGGFYGRNVGIDKVDFANADCGYGATQVTTGMQVGQTVYTPTQQLALTVDYAANIAAGLQILQDKWNQVAQQGFKVNDGNPAYIENWWFALWAYNTGWHNQGEDASGKWGLGWTNNPANEDYPPDRLGYLDTSYDDAKYPNRWSYPERVLGWAFHSLLRLNWKTGVYGEAFQRGSWSNTTPARPGIGVFCTTAIECDMTKIHKPAQFPDDKGSHCLRDDLKCWWHSSVTWVNCQAGCGVERLAYQPGAAEPSPAAKKLYNPDCATAFLPAGALIVDDVDADIQTKAGCAKSWTNHGKLTFKFSADAVGNYPAKIDFHQVDGGFGGHMWTAHTWQDAATATKHKITGTWTLDQEIHGWARVLAYVPDHGAMTPQAVYVVNGTDSHSPTRTVTEGNYLDGKRKPFPGHWESLGTFNFNGTPSVSLNNTTYGVLNANWGDGARSVPWDAIAFQKLDAKPADQIVALGDSYASGEGASADPVDGAWAYYRSSDHDGRNGGGDDKTLRDACHRSPYSWSRQMTLPGTSEPVGMRTDRLDPALDYHMSACSGATTPNLLVRSFGQYQEGSQVDQGYLDQYTTLVTLSMGGNDARFTKIFGYCLTTAICESTTLDGDTEPLYVAEPALIAGAVQQGIEHDLDVIHELAPNAKILFMGYPTLLSSGVCLVGIGIEQPEYDWINQMSDKLNESTRDIAIAHAKSKGIPVTWADPRTAFAGRGACASNALIHDAVFSYTRGDDGPPLPSAQSLHPTVEGAGAYADVATVYLNGM